MRGCMSIYWRKKAEGIERKWTTTMKIKKEEFVNDYADLYKRELLERLPPEELTTIMLHKAGQIINDINVHIIAGIHQSLKKKEDG